MHTHFFQECYKFRTQNEKTAFKEAIIDGIETYHPSGHRDIMFNEVFGGPLLVMRHSSYERISQPPTSINGMYDGPLTEKGKVWITHVAENLQQYLPKGIVIVSSNAQRAIESANLLSEELEKFDTLTVKTLHIDEFCEKFYQKMTKEYMYDTLRHHNLFTSEGISCVTIVISHEPNLETYYNSIGGKSESVDLGYMTALSENRNVFQEGIPQMD